MPAPHRRPVRCAPGALVHRRSSTALERPAQHHAEQQGERRDQDRASRRRARRALRRASRAPAAACSIVRPGRSSGRCASAQPAITAATATTETARAGSSRPRRDEPERRDAGERRDARPPRRPASSSARARAVRASCRTTISAANATRAGHDRGPERAHPERRRRGRRADRGARVGGEPDRGDVRGARDRERHRSAIDVGFSQLVTRSPRALPGGTRPDAMPPIAAPSANGVTIDESANRLSTGRCARSDSAWPRST